MPAYRSAGGLDDAILVDGDRGFVGMNQRLQRNQLKEGEVWLSQNGRMEGFWQGRKGMVLRSGVLDDGSTPLLLPFLLLGDAGNPVADQLDIVSAFRSGNLVTMTMDSGIGAEVGDQMWVQLGSYSTPANVLTGGTNVPSGLYLMTLTAPNKLRFANTGGNETLTVSGTYGYVESPYNDDSASTNIWGSCLFSDPSSSNEESILLAMDNVVKKVDLKDFAVTDIDYPQGGTLSADVDMIQAFGCVVIFRDGQRCWTWKPNGAPIISASLTSNVVTVRCQNHGLTAGDVVTIANLGYVTTNPNGSRTVATVTSADTFTFSLTGANETYTVTDYSSVVADFFVLGPAGSYTQPQTFTVAGNASGFTVTNGLVSLPVTSNTTIVKGDTITIYETDISEFSSIVGKSYEVVAATSTQIQFYAPVGNFTGAGSSTQIEVGGIFSIGGGFIHPPGAPWGVYFQRRMWLPYFYEPNGTYSSPTYTDRKVRDQIVASDILDPATYDQIASQFRITAGVADYLVAMQPFYEDSMIVLMRNSLHIIVGTQGSLDDTITKELTREVGCLARKSVVTQGNAVFFLSDNGVYGVDFIEQYNLRGIQEPLSKPIQPFIDRINKGLASNSIGIYFNNRYWLAVPLDSAPGANDAIGNNTVLVYNLLNQGWESVDSYGAGINFNIINFHIGAAEERNSLYAVNEFGGVHEIDASETQVDVLSTSITGGSVSYNVDSQLQTRGYDMKSFDRKRFTVAQVQVQANNAPSDLIFEFSAEDPDATSVQIGTVQGLINTDLPSNESANLRMRTGGYRGFYGTLTIKNNLTGSAPVGRAKVNSIALEGSITNRATLSQF